MKCGMLIAGAMLWLAGTVFAPPVLAGDLNPPGPPAPTMKRLDQIAPPWDQVLPVSERFKLVMGGDGVLDNETGLVWEKSIDTALHTWTDALSICFNKFLGGRKGWRLPTIEELASLTLNTRNQQDWTSLPGGHPFNIGPNGPVWAAWSATTNAALASTALRVYFVTGDVYAGDKTDPVRAWCLRGGRGHDAR